MDIKNEHITQLYKESRNSNKIIGSSIGGDMEASGRGFVLHKLIFIY